jgi:hypothetical protein
MTRSWKWSVLALLAMLIAERPATAACSGSGSLPPAITLSVQGDHFAVNGGAEFLVFVSYFDGMRRISGSTGSLSTTVLDADFDCFVWKGIRGVRVFANWNAHSSSETLMDSSGALQSLPLEKLEKLIDRASAKGLVVDVTFIVQADHLTGVTAAEYLSGIQAATTALIDKRNILFDIQNELDRSGNQPSGWTGSVDDYRDYLGGTILPAIKTIDPARLVTVSWTSGKTESVVFDNVQDNQYDVLTDHYGNSVSGWESGTGPRAEDFRDLFTGEGPWRPIYFQEPERFPRDQTSSHYTSALTNAKNAGVAAWTLHNSSNDTGLSGSTAFYDLLYSGERTVMDGIASALNTAWGVTLPHRYQNSDYDSPSDLTSDLAVWRPSSKYWLVSSSGTGYDTSPLRVNTEFGLSADTPLSADFDGDGVKDLVTWRPSTGGWYICRAATGFDNCVGWTAPFGDSTDIPISGDFDGDGINDLAVWRPSTGYWYVATSSSGYNTSSPAVSKSWGQSGDIPVPGDFDEDGKTDLAVWRPTDGKWYVCVSVAGFASCSSWAIQFGQSGDVPIAGDFDGDRQPDLAFWRPSTGYWYVSYSGNSYTSTNVSVANGIPGDVPISADFDGDGRTDLIVWRPSTGGWYVIPSHNNYNVVDAYTTPFGEVGDIPLTTTPGTLPAGYSFTALSTQSLNTQVESEIVQITGVTGKTAVGIVGSSAQFRICSSSTCIGTVVVDWTTSGAITGGQYLQLRITSSSSDSTAVTATVTVGSRSTSWSVTTQDASPTTFSFTNLPGNGGQTVLLSTQYNSDIVQITGITGSVGTSISGDASAAYRICNDSSCSSVAVNWTTSTSTISNNKYLQLRMTSSSSHATLKSMTVYVGSGSSTWTITTN